MKKAIIIFAVLAATFAAWVMIFPSKNPLKKWFGKKTQAPGTTAQPIPNQNIQPGSFNPIGTTTKDLAGFPLSQGSRGTLVKAMQTALNNRFGSGLVVDGIFGPKTYKAISSNGFNADSVTYTTYKQILGA